MATVESVDELRKELQLMQTAQLERIQLAEQEVVAIKAMEVPNFKTLQTLVETIATRVKTLEEQMGTARCSGTKTTDKLIIFVMRMWIRYDLLRHILN